MVFAKMNSVYLFIANYMSYKKELDEILRVDLAGEYGAVRIYEGQIDALKSRGCNPELLRELKKMRDQELEHLKFFQDKLPEHGARPTILHPIWHMAGYALGYITGKMGKESAMACTVAIEEVIDEHYSSQLDSFALKNNSEIRDAISKFRDDELEHKDAAIMLDAERAPFYRTLSASVKVASRIAIWLSKRF